MSFELLFEKAPAALLVLAPDLTIVEVTDSYLRTTRRERRTRTGIAIELRRIDLGGDR